jgi:hypothetical protein
MIDQKIFIYFVASFVLAATFAVIHKVHDGLKHLNGPASSWPNGQLLDKFFAGERKASAWKQTYGPVYRVRSLFTSEVYVAKTYVRIPTSIPIAYYVL